MKTGQTGRNCEERFRRYNLNVCHNMFLRPREANNSYTLNWTFTRLTSPIVCWIQTEQYTDDARSGASNCCCSRPKKLPALEVCSETGTDYERFNELLTTGAFGDSRFESPEDAFVVFSRHVTEPFGPVRDLHVDEPDGFQNAIGCGWCFHTRRILDRLQERLQRVTASALGLEPVTCDKPPVALEDAKHIGKECGLVRDVKNRVCCERPLISKGLLDEAVRQAEATARMLAPLAQQGTPILFCDPGCYSAVRDDHPHLLRGDSKRQSQLVAVACVTLEEWATVAIGRALEGNNNETPSLFRTGPKKILLHGHCHQQSLVGTGPAVRLLSMIADGEVFDLDSGCCSMAGSFGYEREHYDVSRAVGERKLFPAIRDAQPDTIVVAPGFSCRHQIKHFTGVDAPSPAVLLLSLMIGTDCS